MRCAIERQLPTILCLHGSGTSAAIFKVQTLKIQWALKDHFNFIYIDAPFVTAPGPGVLPFFADSGPFYAWQPCDTTIPERMRRETSQLLKETFAQCSAAGGPVVAVLGFSQGARVATGLLLARHDPRFATLQTGVLINSTFPAMLPDMIDENQDADESVTVPTVNVHGLLDPYLPQSRALLAAYFLSSLTVLLECNVPHQVPTSQKDVKALTTAVLETQKLNNPLQLSGLNNLIETASSRVTYI